MDELVNLFVNNGVAVACLIYFMWYNNTTLKEFSNKFEDLNNTLLKLLLENSEQYIDKKIL